MRACMGWPETIRSRRLGYPLPAPGEIPVLSQGKWPDTRLTDGDTTASPACLTWHVGLSFLALRPTAQQARCPQMTVTAPVFTTEFIPREKSPNFKMTVMKWCLLMTYLNCEEFTCPVSWRTEDPIRRTTFMKWWPTTPLPSILHRNKEAWNPWPKIIFKIRLV